MPFTIKIGDYTELLKLAIKYGCTSVAFPLISAGAYSYPKNEALKMQRKQ